MEDLFDKKKLKTIKDRLTARKETLAIAESVTSGLLQLAIGSAEDAMQFYQGGMTAYNLGQKTRHLGLDPIYALSCNCVSDEVSRRMALAACDFFCCDWGIGVTGYASPVPESGNKVYCHFAIASKGKIIAEDRLTSSQEKPFDVQLDYVRDVLDRLIACLE